MPNFYLKKNSPELKEFFDNSISVSWESLDEDYSFHIIKNNGKYYKYGYYRDIWSKERIDYNKDGLVQFVEVEPYEELVTFYREKE